MKALRTSKQTIEERPGQNTKLPRARKRWFFRRGLKLRLLMLMLCSLAVLFLLHVIVVYAQSPLSQPTNCAALINSADYPQVVDLQAQTQQMSAVQVDNNLDNGAPAALVQVTNEGGQKPLDVYVFGCTMQQNQPHLTRLFSRQGLAQGTVEITPEHTLLTENLDTNLSPDVIPFLQPLQQNVYHEYAWRMGKFVQIPYAGFYPVASRAEAQELQQSANSGQSLPWNDPVSTALQMSKDLLQWSPAPQAQLFSHIGNTALVELTEQSPHIVMIVTLKQLVQAGDTGLWFVTDARTKGMIITQAGTTDRPLPSPQTSPLRFGGANALIDGHTTATLFDHTMNRVSQASNVPVTVHPDSTYTGSIAYKGLVSGQQGILLVSSLPLTQNLNRESGQVILSSVILN